MTCWPREWVITTKASSHGKGKAGILHTLTLVFEWYWCSSSISKETHQQSNQTAWHPRESGSPVHAYPMEPGCSPVLSHVPAPGHSHHLTFPIPASAQCDCAHFINPGGDFKSVKWAVSRSQTSMLVPWQCLGTCSKAATPSTRWKKANVLRMAISHCWTLTVYQALF